MKWTILKASIVGMLLSSCVTTVPQQEKPIRPTSENSDIAHGSSAPTGSSLGGLDALSR